MSVDRIKQEIDEKIGQAVPSGRMERFPDDFLLWDYDAVSDQYCMDAETEKIETAQIERDVRDATIRNIVAANPPQEIVVYDLTHVGIPCEGADYAVIGKTGDPVTECTIRFMKENGLTFIFIDIDSKQGFDLMFIAGFAEMDIPYIYSAKRAVVVHIKSCPKTMRDLL
jgi:hypothetical protein